MTAILRSISPAFSTMIVEKESVPSDEISKMITEVAADKIPRLPIKDVNQYLQQTYGQRSVDRAYTILFVDERKTIKDFIDRLFDAKLNPTETISGEDAKYLDDVVKRVYNKVL